MKIADKSLAMLALFPLLAGVQSCTPGGTYQIDTFAFMPTQPVAAAAQPQPSVWIDTNIRLSSLSGGTVTSRLPCAAKLDYTDNSKSMEAAVLTQVQLTYDDGVAEPSLQTLKLPLKIKAREYEVVNSMAGGEIVKSKVRVVSGEVPNLITRDQPFTLQIAGHFVKLDGQEVAFTIEQHFDIQREKGEKPAAEVLMD